MIRLEKITPDNWRFDLKVADSQQHFVSEPMQLLARAYAFRDYRSNAFVIYNDDCPVGMSLYYDCESLETYILSQMFIDERYQGHGYGTLATNQLIDKMKADNKYKNILLCYIEGNDSARKLYEKAGFKLTGERDEDEIIMKLEF